MKNKILNYLEKIFRTDIRYVIKGFFWFGIEYAVDILTGIATSSAFANLLSPETYGTYKYIITISSFLGITTLRRMNISLTTSIAKKFEGDIVNTLKTRMKWGLLGSLAGLFLSAYYYINGNANMSALVLTVSIFIPLFEPSLIYNSVLSGKKNFKLLAIINSITSVIYSAVIISAILLSKNIFVILVVYFSVNIIMRFSAFTYVYKKYPPNKEREEKTISYGKKINILEVVNVISTSLDSLLVFHFLGPAKLAAYVFIKKVPDTMKIIPGYLTTLSTPKFSIRNIGHPDVKKEVIRKTVIFYSGMTVLVLVYILAAPFIFDILFKPYKQYVALSQIYSLSWAVNFGGLFMNFVETNRKLKDTINMHLITTIFSIMAVFFSLKFYGLTGLVIAYVVIRLFASTTRFIFFKMATS